MKNFLAVLLILPTLGFTQTADQIFYNGKILTVDEEFSTAAAIAISADRILAVGDSDEIRALAGPDTLQTDLQGRTVIPGFIDNHLHYLRGTNFAKYELRIHGVTSRQEVLDRITAKGKELGPGKWIFIIGGWHEQQFADQAGGFTTAELDQASPENPVFIQRTYSAFYMNRLAADALAVEHPDWFDEDGVIRVDNRFGRTVMYAALEYFPFAETLGGRMQEVQAFNAYLNSMGVTTAYDVGYLDGSYAPVEALREADQLTLRVFYAARYWADTPRTATAAAEMLDREAPFQRDDNFGMFGIGEHVYGLLHDSTSSDLPLADEYYDEWEKIARSAAKNGWYINEHAMQDLTANRMLTIGEEVGEEYPTKGLRWTLGHVDKIKRPTVLRAKELGWNITLANHTVKVPVEGMASPPVRMIQDSGILWGLGSDGTIVATYNPFHIIWEYTAGKVFPNIVKLQPNQVITRKEALIAHTRSNAYILFMEDDIGSLEAGKYADLVVLDRDYLTVPIDEVRDIKPVLTMMAGKIVYQASDD